MLRSIRFIIIALLFVACSSAATHADGALAFAHATVIPMHQPGLLRDHTIVVREGRIETVAPSAEVELSRDIRILDATGLYVLPGLADMHVHLEHLGDKDLLSLFLAHGVTTIRGMDGRPEHLAWRNAIERGDLVGPTIVTAGPLLDGDPPIFADNTIVTSPKDARRHVVLQKQLGYDFIKVYERLTPHVYRAIISEARLRDLPVAGHVPGQVGLREVMQSGQVSVEHLDGYVELIESGKSPFKERWDYRKLYFAVPVQREKIRRAAELTAASELWNCPTIVVKQLPAGKTSPDELLARDEMQYIPRAKRAGWRMGLILQRQRLQDVPPEELDAGMEVMNHLVRSLHDAGAGLLLGTDCGTVFLVPGSSAHDELQNFIDAGLEPAEALQIGTRDAAEFLGQLDTFGTVVAGRRADLIVVESNPLDDLSVLRRPKLVVARGHLYSRSDLDALLDVLATDAP